MARIARLNDKYWVNFDNHCLYFNGEILVELNRRHLEVLEYLSNYPNCYKTVDDINNYLNEGWLSSSTIRGYIHHLRKDYNPVIEKVISSNKTGAGYIYIGNKIEEIDDNTAVDMNRKPSKKKRKVEDFASVLWNMRPFYQDNNMISVLYYRRNFGDSAGYDENIYSMIDTLMNQSYFGGRAVSLNKLPHDTSNKLIVFKDYFLMEDIIYEEKRLCDFNNRYDLLGLDEEKITMAFRGLNESVETSMLLSGMKACMPMRHLVNIIFESDRIFHFQVWGFLDRLSANKYSIKPLSVEYI